MNDKNEQTIKYALYCRKSTEDSSRQILSLDSQEKEMLRLADSLNLSIDYKFRESKSAKEKGLEDYYKRFGFKIYKTEKKHNHTAIYMSKNI
ncbi:MAG: hypothetical protein WCN88_02495 [Candidatus Falkowbacteria bacterium]